MCEVQSHAADRSVGVNHRTAAVDVRERLSIAPSRMHGDAR